MTVINLRVKKRNIDDKAIDGSKVEFLNQDEFKAQKADGTATSLFKLNSSDKFELLKLPIVGSNPTAPNEISRKDYVDTGDSAVRGEFAAADALVLAEAKEYTDDKVGLEESARMAEDALIRSEFAAADASTLQMANSYTDTAVASEAAARSAEDATLLKKDGSRPLTGKLTAGFGIDMDGSKVSDLGTPTDASDAATKGYVDGQIQSNVTDKLAQPSGIATLDGSGKVPVAQLPNSIMQYQALWDASTNTPMLSNFGNSPEALGNVYKVSVAGSVDFGSGIAIEFNVNDYAILGINGWEKSDSTDAVSSVNGQAGIVVLDTDDISEGSSNFYFTDSRARSASVTDSYAGNETDKALSVRATKELAASYQINVDAALESRAAQEKFSIIAQDVTNQYIDLSSKAIAATIVPSIDRLLLIEGYDYTVSIVGGKTRLSFIGSIAANGFEALAVGDKVVVRYLKDLR